MAARHPEPRHASNGTASRPAPLRLVRDETEALSYDALIDAAQQAEVQGQRIEARDLYELALARLTEAHATAQSSDVLRWIARTYRADAELDLALDCAAAALAVAEAHHDDAAIGYAINLQAIIHWQSGQLDEAERLYHQARESARKASETRLLAMTAQNLGVIANIRGDLETALQYYQESLAEYRRLGLASDVCVALNNLGMVYTHRSQWTEAERSYDEAAHVAAAVGDQYVCVQIEVNRAECLVAQGRYDEARDVCTRVEEAASLLKDRGALGELKKVLGIIARETGDHDLAGEYLSRAQEIASQRQDLLLLAEATKESAELHQRAGRNRDTLQSLNRAHRLFAQLRARRELADVGRRMGRLESAFLDVVHKWGESIESKDGYTQGHCERVAAMACALAARTGMDEQSLFWFRIGALLHDVGKLIIPAEVLNKAGTLSPEEWELVRRHPTAGVEMLAEVEFPWDVRPIVESHHERWDGKGYPHGLAGEAIPVVARILCIADVYDALTSERSYKKALSHADAIELMRLDAGVQFDPRLFALFEEVALQFANVPGRLAPVATRAPMAGRASVASGVDELTELPLRRAFHDAASRALAARGASGAVSMLVIDVDHFKLINDTHGHLRGDEVLRQVARTLRAHVRDGDCLARYAGDEFVLLMPATALDDALVLAEQLRNAVHAIPIGDGVGPVALTISVGAAAAPEHGVTVETLFARADAALFEAKRRGRDTVAAVGRSADNTRPQPRLERFVGRHDERRRLADLVDHAVHGRPSVLSLLGEAGAGKTALLRELLQPVRLRAASLVSARCADTVVRPAYQPWSVVLDAVRVLRIVPDRAWRRLPWLIPALGDVPPVAAQDERGELFEEVAEYLRLATSVRPLVVVLDDVQWADTASWDLFEYVAGRLDRERLLLVIAMRSEELQGGVMERRLRLSRDERFHELRIPRLGAADVSDWLTGALGHEPSAELLAAVQDRAEGNPFFVAQFMRAWLDTGELAWNAHEWRWQPAPGPRMPTAVRDLLARRVALLSAPARRTLAAAAVMGRVVDIDRAVAAGIASEDELLDAIDEGIGAAVLDAVVGQADDRVMFRHALFIDVLHENLHPRRVGRIRDRLAHGAPRTFSQPAESDRAVAGMHDVRRSRKHDPSPLTDRDPRAVSWH